MDARLQELWDHHEIRKTLAQYCNACDRCDEPRVRDVYVEDSFDDHGIVQAPGWEYARIMTGMVRDTTQTMSHSLGQSIIKVDGDTAGAETYFIAVAMVDGEDGVEVCNQLGGRFIDMLVRDGDRWRIKHRRVIRDWSVAVPLALDWESTRTLAPGHRSNDDLSYDVLGLVHGDALEAQAAE